jgi:hypothetical protein
MRAVLPSTSDALAAIRSSWRQRQLGPTGARFVIYGAAGWVAEVFFTGAAAALFERDRLARATTSLWMHPIYGLAGLALEQIQARLKPSPRLVRYGAYLSLMYGVEYASGWVLKRCLGVAPWDYTGRGLNIHGLIRLDYAPAWLALGVMFEPFREATALLAEKAFPAPCDTPVDSLTPKGPVAISAELHPGP